MARKSKKRKKTLGKYGPPGEIKYRKAASGNKRSALDSAAMLPRLPKGQGALLTNKTCATRG